MANLTSALAPLALAILLCLPISETFAQVAPQRYALVIGNADYNGDGRLTPQVLPEGGFLSDLATPRNDADDVAKYLTAMHFDVTVETDRNYREMNDAINNFATKVLGANRNATDNAVVLIYYAGHGVSVGGINFLIPTQAVIPANNNFAKVPTRVAQREMRDIAIDADDLLTTFRDGRPTGLTILIIDACRDSPWDRSVRSVARGNNESGGLAPMLYVGSAIVGFSASPNRTAADVGDARNSPFAKAFISVPAGGKKSFPDFWIDVDKAVRQATNDQQEPWLSGYLRDHFCLDVCDAASARPVDRTTQQIEKLYAPLNVSLAEGDVEWAGFRERFNREFGRRNPLLFRLKKDTNGVEYRSPIPLTDAEWKVWMDGVHHLFKQRNDALTAIINENPSLLEGRALPDCFAQFFLHRDAFNASLAKADGDPTVRVWDPSHGFPTCFAPSVQATLSLLEERQARAVAAARP